MTIQKYVNTQRTSKPGGGGGGEKEKKTAKTGGGGGGKSGQTRTYGGSGFF